MSPIKMSDMQVSNSLITEVSPEQAAVVAGGLRITIHRIQCLKAGADNFFGGGDDDVQIRADGQLLNTRAMKMNSGRTRDLAIGFSSFFKSSVSIDLFDDDSPTSQDDFLGGFTTGSTGGQVASRQVSGSGSRYRIFYSAV